MSADKLGLAPQALAGVKQHMTFCIDFVLCLYLTYGNKREVLTHFTDRKMETQGGLLKVMGQVRH